MRYFFEMASPEKLFYALMLLLLGLFAVLLVRRRKNRKLVRAYTSEKKEKLLNDLATPFGYGYDAARDLFYTRVDAWQRQFGYRRAYDEAALSAFMIIHCLPVYFDYDGKTWLMEFWKGEYGITAGCEVGLYHADTVLLPGQYGKARFEAASDEEMMDMSVMFMNRTGELFSFRMRHWWLACFAVGRHELPEELSTLYRLRFPTSEMKHAFVEGLLETGFSGKNIRSTSNATLLLYHNQENALPFTGVRSRRKMLVHIYNGILCFLYNLYTRPFTLQGDRILFLYKQMPFVLRHMLKYSGKRRNRPRKENSAGSSPGGPSCRRRHHGI